MRLVILAEAQQDLLNGYHFYENQQIALGDYFYDSLFADIDSLLITTGIHQKNYGFYQKLATKFPFAIYYQVENDWIKVYAVLDCRKNPSWINLRLNQ